MCETNITKKHSLGPLTKGAEQTGPLALARSFWRFSKGGPEDHRDR